MKIHQSVPSRLHNIFEFYKGANDLDNTEEVEHPRQNQPPSPTLQYKELPKERQDPGLTRATLKERLQARIDKEADANVKVDPQWDLKVVLPVRERFPTKE